jgi:hypothetical protein
LLPYSTSRRRGPPFAGFAGPLRSALRVWLPSRRFPPFSPAPVLFRTGSALGIHSSELSPREGRPSVSFRPDPHTVSASPVVRRRNKLRHRFLGFAPSESPSRNEAGLAPRSLDAPLSFALPGHRQARTLTEISPGLLLRAWQMDGIAPYTACTIECRSVRTGHATLRPAPWSQARGCQTQVERAALLGFLRQYAPKR